jgi:hypothetical protein
MSAVGLAVPTVLQRDGPVAELGAGDQVEPVGLGNVVEQLGTLASNLGLHVEGVLPTAPWRPTGVADVRAEVMRDHS